MGEDNVVYDVKLPKQEKTSCVKTVCHNASTCVTCRFDCLDVKIPSFIFDPEDKLEIGTPDTCGISQGSYSISFFLKPDYISNQYIVSQNMDSGKRVKDATEGSIVIGITDEKIWLSHGSQSFKISSPTQLSKGKYTHHAFIVDLSAGTMKYFCNGGLRSQVSSELIGEITNFNPIRIGGPTGRDSIAHFSGRISQFRVHLNEIDKEDVYLALTDKVNYEGILGILDTHPKSIFDADLPLNKEVLCCCVGSAYAAGAKCIE
jgi:hypothetical protein